MNAFNTASPSFAVKTLLLTMVTIGLFAGVAATAGQAGAKSKQVTFADLDLTSVQGQKIAQERVHQVARTLCSQVADSQDLSHQPNYVACVEEATAKAGASLQALVKQRATSTLARNTVK